MNDRDEASDDHGHGTHVAGTIAQTTNNGKGAAGIAFCARLMPIKVLTRQGWGTVADVAEGIRFAADEGAQVVNLSLGGPIKSRILEDAVDHALKRGVVDASPGGEQEHAARRRRLAGMPAYDGVVAVSAFPTRTTRSLGSSSRGPYIVDRRAGRRGDAQPDGLRQQEGATCEIFGTFNGTSMASPHVAGAVALLMSEGVTEPGAVRAALAEGATPKDDASLYGAGILGAGASVAAAFTRHLLLRLAALVALFVVVARRIRRRKGEPTHAPLAFFSAIFAAVGLAPFAPYVGLLGRAGALRPWVELLARPLGEWDIALGAGVHRWLPLAGALPAIVAASVFFGVKRARPAIGGLALGSAALAAQMAISGDVAFVLGTWGMRLYALASMAVCVWIARVALDGKRA